MTTARRFVACVLPALLGVAAPSATHAQAPTIFFAEDLNLGDPGGAWVNNYGVNNPYDLPNLDGPMPLPLAARPLVNAARAAYVGLFQVIDVESFETYSTGGAIGTPIPDNTALGSVYFSNAQVTGTFVNSQGAPTSADIQTIPGAAPAAPGPDGTHNGTYPTHGTNFLLSSAGNSTRQFRLALDTPVNAFAASLTDLDGSGQLTVTLVRADGMTEVHHPVAFAAGQSSASETDNLTGPIVFWGIVDPVPFQAIIFNYAGSTSDGIGIDELIIGESSQLADTCAVEPVECQAAGGQVLWGAMELADGSLKAFRCTVAGEGSAPVCELENGALKPFDPVCE